MKRPSDCSANTRFGEEEILALDEHGLAHADWTLLDEHSGLKRWRVQDPGTQRQWLIISADPTASSWDLARLDREYAMASCLKANWAVIPLTRLTTPKGPALVLDDDAGVPLSGLTMGSFSVTEFLHLAISITTAVARTHQHGIIHRDIRPATLILDANGVVRLSGFAFASINDGHVDSAPQTAHRSLAYQSPEQAGGSSLLGSAQTDLYALGVTFYQLLTGHLPFSADDPLQWRHQHVAVQAPALAKWRPGLPPAIETVVAGLLSKQPEKRPSSALALSVELHRCLSQCPTMDFHTRSPALPLGPLQPVNDASTLTMPSKPSALSEDLGALTDLQRVELYRLKCEVCALHGDYAGALESAVEGLALLGVQLPATPSDEQVEAAWRHLQQRLNNRPLEVFSVLALIEDPTPLAIVGLLNSATIPGSFIHPNLLLLMTSQILITTLDHGMSAAAVQGLAWLGVAIAQRYDALQQGFEFALTARKLAEQPAYASSKVAVLVALDQVSVWSKPIPYALECAESAYRLSLAEDSPSFACFANNHIVSDLLVLGAPIERMLRQIDTGLELANTLDFADAQSILYVQAQYIRRLAGHVSGKFPIPTADVIAERVRRSSMGPLHFWWELFEGLFHFLEGSFELASAHMDRAWALTWSAPVHIHQIDLALFTVLNRAALQTSTGITQDFEQPMQRLRLWAESNPRYFADRLALAEAQVLRANGQMLEALQHYELAIGKASESGVIHIQGLAHQMESHFLDELGLQVGAQTHLRLARDAWRRWGATKLADQLEAAHPFLRERAPEPIQTYALPGTLQRDMVSITKACQALSREVEPDALIQTLLANAAEHAGASYAALLLMNDGVLSVAAAGQANAQGIDIRLRAHPTVDDAVPMSLITAVIEQGTSLLISGADALRCFGDDAYLGRIEQASVACVPLLKQNEVIGVLYLENTLTPRVFESTRLDVLELLTAQAAITLTNIDLRMARSELARTSQATILGELSASIAHEINQPLASILSNAGASVRWLEREQPQIDMALEGLKDILAEGQRAADIVSAMRSLAKQAPPERKPVDVGEVIRHVLTVTQADILERHVRVRLDLSPDTRTHGDPTQLQQVMHNLITNAVEAMQSLPTNARRLTISTHEFGGTLLVSVEDTGPGISDDQQSQIFQAFYSTKATGMGMGLAICSSILAAHGGTLRAVHGRQEESLFLFTLPRC